MRYFSNSLTITELSKSKTTVDSTGLVLLSKYILQVIGHFNRIQGQWAQSTSPTPIQAPIAMAATTEHSFSLTPAQADNKVINYTSSEGKKLFILATAKLNIEFDGNPANLKIFLESLCHCAHTSNWLQIMPIPDQTGTC
jgi:uncharacterized protein YjdB